MHPLAEAGEGCGVDVVAVISQPTGDGLPTLAPEPSATDQHVSCHLQDLLVVYAAPNGVRSVPFEAASRGGAYRGTTAMASISMRKSGCASPATKAAVIAGGFGVSTHAR